MNRICSLLFNIIYTCAQAVKHKALVSSSSSYHREEAKVLNGLKGEIMNYFCGQHDNNLQLSSVALTVRYKKLVFPVLNLF